MKSVIFASLIVLVTGCSKGTIQVGAIEDLIGNVTTRHDVYVSGDGALTETQKTTYLRSSTLLRDVVEAAKE